jgi:SAM-dependent methyltransferase
MDDPEQALAYTQADFSASHGRRVAIFRELFPQLELSGAVLDLGCGSGDVLLRFARAFPSARFVGLDGSKPMIALAQSALQREPELAGRVRFIEGVLPGCALPDESWDLIMSHSVLHQLHEPLGLWRTIASCARPGCAVFVADLRRPRDEEQARALVAEAAAGEPAILQRDFFNSLRAAFEPHEVRSQLRATGLTQLAVLPQEPFHLTVHGRL